MCTYFSHLFYWSTLQASSIFRIFNPLCPPHTNRRDETGRFLLVFASWRESRFVASAGVRGLKNFGSSAVVFLSLNMFGIILFRRVGWCAGVIWKTAHDWKLAKTGPRTSADETLIVETRLVCLRRALPIRYLDGRVQNQQSNEWVRAGVCRPCDTIELTTTSCNFSLCRRVEKVCVDRQLLRYSWSRS